MVIWEAYSDYMNSDPRTKAHLSEYMRKAAGGEQILVMDQGRPVARLVSLGGTSMLDRGISEGWITPPSREALTPALHCKALLSTTDVLDEDRGG